MKISEITTNEFNRQRDTLNLIASENYPSPAVLNLMGSVWSNKYAEGYPGKRYYAGCQQADILEDYVKELALTVFDPITKEYDVNLQVLSGSPANLTVFLSVLKQNDKVLKCIPSGGGHISHLQDTSSITKALNIQTIDFLISDNFEINYEDFEIKVKENSPRLVILGFSSYPYSYSFEKLIRIIRDNSPESLILADVAHINGLIAVNEHSTPFQPGFFGADFITMTTHKTLRGPRGAMLFFKKEHTKLINKTIFPGLQGGPHLNKIASIGRCLEEILGIEEYPDGVPFKTYIQRVKYNTIALETGLQEAGIKVLFPKIHNEDDFKNHLTVVKLLEISLDSLTVQNNLQNLNIICNRNVIPNDKKTPWIPSGLRLGTAALTSRGAEPKHFVQLGRIIAKSILNVKIDDSEIKDILSSLKWYY